MGERGPVPKRSSQRRRTNKPEGPDLEKAAGADDVPIPDPDVGWHPVARRWFESLAQSGQHVFYEPSDWATACLIAESMSRDLNEQVVGIAEKTGEVVMAQIPLKGASLSAYLKAMSSLLVTEGDRRRMRVELERAQEEESADVSDLAEHRRRARSV